jgi:hypothetical protein
MYRASYATFAVVRSVAGAMLSGSICAKSLMLSASFQTSSSSRAFQARHCAGDVERVKRLAFLVGGRRLGGTFDALRACWRRNGKPEHESEAGESA